MTRIITAGTVRRYKLLRRRCGYAAINWPDRVSWRVRPGPHYYRWFNGAPFFGIAEAGNPWAGWTRINFGLDTVKAGLHGGHWDRVGDFDTIACQYESASPRPVKQDHRDAEIR